MGKFDDLLEGAYGEPVWRDMFKWRCPRCNTILSPQGRYPAPGEEDSWFESTALFKHTRSLCGFTFGIDPLRAYYRCPTEGLCAMPRNCWPGEDFLEVNCSCGKIHSVADLKWESAAEPLYLEKAQRSDRSMAIQRVNTSQSMPPAGINTPKRIIQRRMIQTSDGTFAEETIVEF